METEEETTVVTKMPTVSTTTTSVNAPITTASNNLITTSRVSTATTKPTSSRTLVGITTSRTTTTLVLPAGTTTAPVDRLTEEELEILSEDSIAIYDVNHTASIRIPKNMCNF